MTFVAYIRRLAIPVCVAATLALYVAALGLFAATTAKTLHAGAPSLLSYHW